MNKIKVCIKYGILWVGMREQSFERQSVFCVWTIIFITLKIKTVSCVFCVEIPNNYVYKINTFQFCKPNETLFDTCQHNSVIFNHFTSILKKFLFILPLRIQKNKCLNLKIQNVLIPIIIDCDILIKYLTFSRANQN